jgi:hypothetical protein
MAPKTPLAERTPLYLAAYGRTLNAAYRFERIQNEIKDEQGRVQYLDSLIGQERQTLAGLQQVFRAEPLSLEAAQALLGDLSAAEKTAALALAQQGATRKAATTPTKAALADLRGAYATNPAAGYAKAEALINGATPEYAKAIIAALPSTASAADKQGLAAFAKTAATGKVPKGKEAAATPQAQAVASALEAAYFAGPTGIRGGYDGMAVVERRKLTADQLEAQGLKAEAEALRKSGFGTQQDAFNAALEAVRLTGDPQALEDAFARDLYIEARNTQAYTNAERADFEQEVLDSRKRIAKLEGERRRIADAYEDPAQEAIERELRARGYLFAERGSADEWKNRYVQYQNTQFYNPMLKADRLVDTARTTGKPLAPTTKAENMVTTLAMQYERTETPFDLNTLRTQLEKAPDLSAAEVEDALGFIVAYRELGGEKQDPKQLEFQRKTEEFQRQSDEKRRQQAQALQVEVDRARKVTRDLEAQQVRTVEQLRADQAALNAPSLRAAELVRPRVEAEAQRSQERLNMTKEYARLRSLGLSAEEARKLTLDRVEAPLAPMTQGEVDALRTEALKGFVAPQARPSGETGIIRPSGPDFALERADRIEAARQRPQDYTPSPPAIRIYEDTRAVAPAPAVEGGTTAPAAPPKAPPARTRTPPDNRRRVDLDALEAAAPGPAAPPPPAPKSEKDQLKSMLTNGTLKPGTAQFNAALDRLDELEGR